MEKQKYITIERDNLDGLAEAVNNELANGYTCTGGMGNYYTGFGVTLKNWFYQSLVLKDEVKIEPVVIKPNTEKPNQNGGGKKG